MSLSLNLDSLVVASFSTVSGTGTIIGKTLPDLFCCTGCDSGCGINPTALGCESGGGDRTILQPQPLSAGEPVRAPDTAYIAR